jgi:CDP-diacylglycerol--glycerol-3-phosphate 3-phosphatidyltransferase/cardiolipin synthase
MISNTVTSLRIVLVAALAGLLVVAHGDAARWWALAVFLAAGLTDVVDGFLARRLNEVSAFGAMLDLISDRLLTLAALGGLIAAGALNGLAALAALVLIARDLVAASLNEALPGRLGIRVWALERIKITAHFVGVGLLIAPVVWRPAPGWGQYEIGRGLLELAALLAVATIALYWTRALRVFAGEDG